MNLQESIRRILREVRVPRSERVELYKDDNIIVVVPLTHRALQKYAHQCQWCINSDLDEWEEYHKGKHAVIIQRNPKKPKIGITGNPTASEIFLLSKWDNNQSSFEDVCQMLDYEFRNDRTMSDYYVTISNDINNFATNIVYYSPENGIYDQEDNFLWNFNYEITDIQNVTPEVIKIMDDYLQENEEMSLQESIRRILREENEMETTLYDIFGEYPDEDELVWNYVGQLDFKKLKFPIKRVDIRDLVNKDFIENFKSNAESWQKKYVKHITKNIDKFNHIPIIVDFDNNIIIDGNHRLMGMYLSNLKDVYVVDINDTNLQESIRRILREEINSDDIKSRQEEAAELIKQYGHYSSPDLRYITRPLYAYIEYENFGRLKELGVKYRFTPISEINLNGALSRFIKERGVFNGIGGNIIRLYNDEPVTKSDISRIKRKIQNIIDEFNTKLRTNYQIDGVTGEKSSDTLRNQLNQKLTGSEFNIEPTYNNIGIKISRGIEDEYLATIPMDEIDKPQMLD